MSGISRAAEERIASLERIIEAGSPGPWLLYSEPEVNLPQSIMKPLDGGGIDMIEPLNCADQASAVECRNAAPLLIAEIRELRRLLQSVVSFANEAHAKWDADEDMRVGKMLIALAGGCPGYRPETDAIHNALKG